MSEPEDPPPGTPDRSLPNREGIVRRFGSTAWYIWRRFGLTAVVGYLVVAIFSVAYGIVRLGWPHVADGRAVTVGILASGPIALAFVWERLSGFKVFGVELTLAVVTVRIDKELAVALMASQVFSGDEEIRKKIVRLSNDPTIELLEINLTNKRYWWSTRLFLLAALIEEYTNIQRVVFVDGDRRYVGMATPREVRRSMPKASGANLEKQYRTIVDQVRIGQPGDSEAGLIIESWSTSTSFTNAQGNDEESAKNEVSAEDLRQLVQLETMSVEWDQPLWSAVLQGRVLEKGTRFVPLTQQGRLDEVIDGDAFARACATQALRAKSG